MGDRSMVYIAVIIPLFLITVAVMFFFPVIFSVTAYFNDTKSARVQLWGRFVTVESQREFTRLSLMGISFTFRNHVSPVKEKKEDKKEKVEKKKKEKKSRKKERLSSAFFHVRQPEFREAWQKALLRFFLRLFKVVRFTHAETDLSIGLERPDQTGVLLGFWYSLEIPIRTIQPLVRNIRLTADFERKGIHGSANIQGRTSLARAFMPVLVLLWHAPLHKTFRIVYPSSRKAKS